MRTLRGMRIVSLLPSATEIVAGLGCADLLVGRSHECDTPYSVRALPVVSASRIDPGDLDGAAIDAAVRAAVAGGESLYAVDAALLDALRPDLVITQDLCRVCAVSSAHVCEVGARGSRSTRARSRASPPASAGSATCSG